MLHALNLIQETVGHKEIVTHIPSFLLQSAYVSEKLLSDVNIADTRRAQIRPPLGCHSVYSVSRVVSQVSHLVFSSGYGEANGEAVC
jgi:hypothetical protein